MNNTTWYIRHWFMHNTVCYTRNWFKTTQHGTHGTDSYTKQHFSWTYEIEIHLQKVKTRFSDETYRQWINHCRTNVSIGRGLIVIPLEVFSSRNTDTVFTSLGTDYPYQGKKLWTDFCLRGLGFLLWADLTKLGKMTIDELSSSIKTRAFKSLIAIIKTFQSSKRSHR